MRRLALAVLALAVLAGCPSTSNQPSAPTQKPQAETKPPDYETGRTAFQRLYASARMWAPDTRPFRLESQATKGASGKDGKAGVWRASFASPSRRAIKPFVWSGVTAEDAPPRGVSPGTEDSYSPSNTSTLVFDAAFLKIDSDKAFEVAQQHGGDKLLKKTPDQPVVYVLEWNPAGSDLLWHVIYGTSRRDAKLTVAVNASTGDFLRVEK